MGYADYRLLLKLRIVLRFILSLLDYSQIVENKVTVLIQTKNEYPYGFINFSGVGAFQFLIIISPSTDSYSLFLFKDTRPRILCTTAYINKLS